MYTPKELALRAAKALDDRKGLKIRLLQVTDVTSIADYFLICTGTSNTHVKTLCDSVEAAVADELGEPLLDRATAAERGSCWTSAASSCMSSRRRRAPSMISNACGTTQRRFPLILQNKEGET